MFAIVDDAKEKGRKESNFLGKKKGLLLFFASFPILLPFFFSSPFFAYISCLFSFLSPLAHQPIFEKDE
jgi:hypothetical protein